MFTGIIKFLGQVESSQGGRLRLNSDLGKTPIGASIAVNGTCLTVVRALRRSIEFDLSPETLRLTNLRFLKAGHVVNLEKPMRLGEGLDGHMVSGHVDAVAKILEINLLQDGCVQLRAALPPALRGLVTLKGSVAIDGISLTITRSSRSWFETVLIPHTLRATNLNTRKPGDLVNLEADLIARYVQSIIKAAS